jgi:hypothetical protein
MTDRQKTSAESAAGEQWKADQAFEVYAVLRRAADQNPELKQNPYWQALQNEAFADFMSSFARY